MNDVANGVSRLSALKSARDEYEVARLVHVHLPGAAGQINRHLHHCWLTLLNAGLLQGPGAIDLEDVSVREKLGRISTDKLKVLSDILGARSRDRLGDLLENPSTIEASPDLLVATDKILTAITKECERQAGWRISGRFHRFTRFLLLPLIVVFGFLYVGRGWKMSSLKPTDWFSLDVDQFTILRSEQGWGSLRRDSSVSGKPLMINGTRYEKGLGTHARSSIDLKLSDDAREFYGACGVDAGGCSNGSVTCAVYAGDKPLFQSGLLRFNEPAKEFKVPVDGGSTLTLLVLDGGDGKRCDHADWINVGVISR